MMTVGLYVGRRSHDGTTIFFFDLTVAEVPEIRITFCAFTLDFHLSKNNDFDGWTGSESSSVTDWSSCSSLLYVFVVREHWVRQEKRGY